MDINTRGEQIPGTEKGCNRPSLPPRLIRNMLWGGGAVVLLCLLLIAYLDQPVALAVRNLDPRVILVFRKISMLGNSAWYLIPAFVLFLACRCAVWRCKQAGDAQWWGRSSRFCLLVFCSISASGLLNDALKIVFGRPRPHVFFSGEYDAFSFFQLSSRMWAFPSGHANTIFALATVLLTWRPRGRWFFLPLAVLVSASRVILGKHYPSDVLVGAFLAVVTTQIVMHYFFYRDLQALPASRSVHRPGAFSWRPRRDAPSARQAKSRRFNDDEVMLNYEKR